MAQIVSLLLVISGGISLYLNYRYRGRDVQAVSSNA